MSVVACQFLGRLGNCMFTYAFARSYAEKHGHEFQCDPWDGQKIFQLDDKPITATGLKPRDENNIVDGEGDIIIRSYCQQQKCLIYTRSQVREWFKFQHWVDEQMTWQSSWRNDKVLLHRRVGDYAGYGYPLVSEKSYANALDKLQIRRSNGEAVSWMTEESAAGMAGSIFDKLEFVPDFWRMCHVDYLFRGNSTFSWWAATLNKHGRIFSPVMDGCEGGKEHDVEFVEGNHPKFRSDLSFITDLHLKP